jgi:PAS domain S-box-containing protein
MIYLFDEGSGDLVFAYDAGVVNPEAHDLLLGLRLPTGRGLFGSALARREVVSTDDYAHDERFAHDPRADRIVASAGMRSMAGAPMLANDVPIGVLGAFSGRPGAFGEQHLAILRALADHAGAAVGNLRLLAELERTLAARKALDDIARRIVDVDDPADVLQDIVDVSARLLGADGGHLTYIHEDGLTLVPVVLAGHTDPEVRAWLATQRFPMDGGINGLSARTGAPVWTTDYRADPRWPHEPDDDSADRLELGAVIVAPLRGPGNDIIGTLAITYREPRSVDPRDVALLDDLARQASIAVRNARLYSELRHRTVALDRMVAAQQTLAEIAGQISSIRDPAAIVQRTVDDAVRLLGADASLINLMSSSDRHKLAPATIFSTPDYGPETTDYEPGAGVSGKAIVENRVVRTGDYLNDANLKHTADLDELVRQRRLKSIMAAPLIGPDGPIGTLTVDSRTKDAFTDDDAELLGALAGQVAIALGNAELYRQLEESERRYRELVDRSPDVVWSVDRDGRLLYVGETLERLTGYPTESIVGRPWMELLTADSLEVATQAWERVKRNPRAEQQFRVRTPRADGGSLSAEINMIGNVAGDEFDGAHGSLRDITEREALETDLRRRSAELAANEERAKLARELHDSVTQALFSMGLTLRSYELLLERDPERATAKLTELRELQNDALAEMRTLIFELRPRGLEADGLAQALTTHAAAVAGRTGLEIGVEARLDERLPLPLEEALYRIAQEALHNVVKHAAARSAQVRVRVTDDDVELTVEDDGAGIEPGATELRDKLGLVGMRQRAEKVGGQFAIGRRPGGGTRVVVTVPLQPQAN